MGILRANKFDREHSVQSDIQNPKSPEAIHDPSQTLALWADRLRDISSVGLMFADNIYHRQRYEALQDIALEGHAFRIPEAFRVWRGDPRAYFDR